MLASKLRLRNSSISCTLKQWTYGIQPNDMLLLRYYFMRSSTDSHAHDKADPIRHMHGKGFKSTVKQLAWQQFLSKHQESGRHTISYTLCIALAHLQRHIVSKIPFRIWTLTVTHDHPKFRRLSMRWPFWQNIVWQGNVENHLCKLCKLLGISLI